MATKASIFRYQAERSGPDKPKRVRHPRRKKLIDASKPATSVAEQEAGGRSTPRNRSLHGARKGGVKLEDSLGKASRKSSRRGKGHAITIEVNEEGIATRRKGEGRVKGAATLTLRATMRSRSPAERSRRRGGRS